MRIIVDSNNGDNSKPSRSQFMRGRAEELAIIRKKTDYERKLADRDKLLQELHVHQIELELQNEELRQSQAKLQYTHKQYLDLYNEAPMGYASLDDSGIIIRANNMLAKMLGIEKYTLSGRAIAEYMHPQDQAIFRSRFNAFYNHPNGKYIDIRFVLNTEKNEKSYFVGRIQGRRIDKNSIEISNIKWTETLLIVISDVSELKKSEERIHYQAYHDALTGIPNRTTLYEHLESALSLANRQYAYGALMFMDIDRFKNINDSLGHHTGDELLIGFTRRLRRHIRKEDLFVRMGGDEFVILLAEQHHDKNVMAVNAQRFAEHVEASMSEPIILQEQAFQISLSIGITIYPFHTEDNINDVVRQADTAMYQAKNDGRGLVRFFHTNMQETARQRMTLEAELRVALIYQQFEIFYQPQVSVEWEVHALEGLIRWRHPHRGIIAPDKFIGIAEDTGMIVQLGYWMIENMIKQISDWKKSEVVAKEMLFAINISIKQLESHEFCDRVVGFLKKYNVEPECLVFEITESLLLPNDDLSENVLKRLADIGLTLSVDDFGTGYSSLATIHTAPIGQLKIDRQFIKELHLPEDAGESYLDDREYALVNAILSLGSALGLEIVAEGVESETQRTALQKLGCQYMQGYYFSKPVSAAQVPQLLEKTSNPKIKNNNK